MERILISDVPSQAGKQVMIKGSVKIRRDHGKLIFLDVTDRTGLLQIVVNAKAYPQAYEIGQELRPEDAILMEGNVNNRPANAVNADLVTGTVELEATKIEIISKAQTLPFDMGGKDLNLELPTLLDHRSLTLRHPHVSFIFKVQAAIAEGFRKTAKDLGCTEIFVPTISASSTEGGAEVFMLEYFDYKAFMTQSPQLYKQMLVPVFERVMTIAHAYRAEPSVTTRHLTESTQMDCEFGFAEFDELLDLVETVGMKTLVYAQEQCEKELKHFDVRPLALGKIPRLTLREAQEVVYKETGRDVRNEKDLGPGDEVDLCKWALKTYNSDFVTVTHYPTKKRAFYTMPDPKNPEFSLSYDLLFRGVEILSGSQRINDYDQLVAAIKDRGMEPENFSLYLQAFKYGMPPEGGFSFGLERLTMKLLELSNIREASLFPRDMERVDERLSLIAKKTSQKK